MLISLKMYFIQLKYVNLTVSGMVPCRDGWCADLRVLAALVQ